MGEAEGGEEDGGRDALSPHPQSDQNICLNS